MKSRIYVLGAFVAVLASSFFGRGANAQQKTPEAHADVPSVISQIRSLEIIQWDIVDRSERHAAALIKIKNNSDKSIIAVSLESGNDKGASGVTLNGIQDGDLAPLVVVKPRETFEVRFPLSNVLAGCTVRVAGVFYADGTEDGDEKTLESMRKQKEYRKNKKPENSPQ